MVLNGTAGRATWQARVRPRLSAPLPSASRRRALFPCAAAGAPARPLSANSRPPDGVEALYYEGMAAYQHRHWEEALDRFTRLKELQPTRPGLDALLEEVRWFLQLQAAAPAHGGVVPEADSKRPRGAAGWPRRARAGLYAALAVLALAGLVLVAFGDRLPWRGNRAAEELYNRGEARLAAGDYEGAQAAFQKMLEIAPGDPEAKLGLERAQQQQTLAQGYTAAEIATAEEKWDRAATELAAILAVDPNFPGAQEQANFVAQQNRLATLYTDGGRLYDLGQWEEALSQFEKIRNIDATYRADTVDEFLFVCYINAGEALLKAEGGSLDEAKTAVEYFGQALALHPRNRTASDARRLGGLYLDALQALARGDSEQARSQLSALVGESPTYADGQAALRLYGLIVASGRDALTAGDVPSALDRFDQAQKLPVNDTSAAQQGAALALAATPTPSQTPRSTATATPIPTPWASVATGPVGMRSGPGSAYPSIGELAQGATVAITGRRDDGAWLRVCCAAGGKEGWVASPGLKVSGPLKQAEVVSLPTVAVTRAAPGATRAPRSTPMPKAIVCVQGSILNVAGGQGLAGWLVRMVDASGAEKTWPTNGSGFYRFSDLPPGPAKITVDVLPGWHSVSPLPAQPIVGPGEACVIVDVWAEQSGSGGGAGPAPTPTPIR